MESLEERRVLAVVVPINPAVALTASAVQDTVGHLPQVQDSFPAEFNQLLQSGGVEQLFDGLTSALAYQAFPGETNDVKIWGSFGNLFLNVNDSSEVSLFRVPPAFSKDLIDSFQINVAVGGEGGGSLGLHLAGGVELTFEDLPTMLLRNFVDVTDARAIVPNGAALLDMIPVFGEVLDVFEDFLDFELPVLDLPTISLPKLTIGPLVIPAIEFPRVEFLGTGFGPLTLLDRTMLMDEVTVFPGFSLDLNDLGEVPVPTSIRDVIDFLPEGIGGFVGAIDEVVRFFRDDIFSSAIYVSTLDGNDRIDLSEITGIPMNLYGGSGDNVIIGGGSQPFLQTLGAPFFETRDPVPIRLFGGSGNDTFIVNNNFDVLDYHVFGGGGSDTLLIPGTDSDDIIRLIAGPNGQLAEVRFETPAPTPAAADHTVAVKLPPNAVGGTFRLIFEDGLTAESTELIPFDATAAAVEDALWELPNIRRDRDAVDPRNVQVSGPDGGPWFITFLGDLAARPGLRLMADGALLDLDGSALNVQVEEVRAGSAELASNQIQRITVPEEAAGGTFTVTFQGATTDAIPVAATASMLRSALAALDPIDSADNVRVTRLVSGVWDIEFTGALGLVDHPLLEVDASGLTGGLTGLVEELVVGEGVNQIQQVTPSPEATGGTFTLTFGGLTTPAIPFDATVNQVREAFQVIASPASILIGGSDGGPWTFEFTGALRHATHELIVADGSTLTGGIELLVEETVQGSGQNEVQTISLPGASGGTFRLLVSDGDITRATDPLPFDATVGEVRDAVAALTSVSGPQNIMVSGETGGPWTIEFTGDLAAIDLPTIDVDTSQLLGGVVTIIPINVEPMEEQFELRLPPATTGGTFSLTLREQTTEPIPFNATVVELRDAIEALTIVSGALVSPIGPATDRIWEIDVNYLEPEDDPPPTVADGSNLLGAVEPDVIEVDGQPGENEVQTITRPPETTGGTFTLTFMDATTGAIPFDATATQLRDALVALETVPGPAHLSITELADGWEVEFTGHLAATDVPLLQPDSSNLTGGLQPGVAEIQAALAINAEQRITLPPETTGGTFRLLFDDDLAVLTTAPIASDATAAQVQAALEALPTIGMGNIQVTGGDGGPWTVEFIGSLRATNVRLLGMDASELAGGLEADVEIIRSPAGTNAVQRIQLPPRTFDGTWTLTFEGFTTGPISHDASAGDVQAALQALDSIGPGNVLVTGPEGGPWSVEFVEDRGQAEQPPLEADGNDLRLAGAPLAEHAGVADPDDLLPGVSVIQPGSDGADSIVRSRTVFNSLEDVEKLVVEAGGGTNTLIVDNSAGAIHFPLGIHFDGNTVILQGDEATAVTSRVAAGQVVTHFGPNPQDLQQVFLGNTTFVTDLVPAENLVVEGTDADNAINYIQSPDDPTWGRVTVDDTLVVDFANKEHLIIEALAGSDTINLNNPTTPAGLENITVHGGDPTASDKLVVNGTIGADTIDFTPTAADAGTVVGAQPVPVNFTTIESLIINGQGGDDTLNVNVPDTDSTVVLTPGATVDSGQVQVDSLVPLSFTNLGAAGELNITSTGGTDTLIYNGTEASDTFVVPHPTAAAPSIGLNDQIGVSTLGVANYTLRGLGGDDTFTITPQAEVAIRVEGDEPSGSDTLNFVRDDADGLATTVVVELDAVPADPSLIQTIEQPGLGAVTLLGIETANINANVADVFVAGTRFDDVIHFTPHSASSATVTAAGIATVFHFSNVPAANTFRVSGGSFGFADKVIFHGTNGRDRIRVDVPDRTVELDVQDMGFPPSPLATWRSVTLDDGTAAFGTPGIIESVQVLGHDGNDTFHVVPGPAVGNGLFVKIDGGSPLGSDALVITELNGDNNPTPLAPTDFVVVGKSRVEDAGSVLVFRSAERLPGISYQNIEMLWANVDPVDPNTGDPNLLILGPDLFEPNDFRATASFLGSGSTINVQNLALFPNDLEHIGVPADQDYFRVVAEKTGTLDFQVYFRTFDPTLLPGGGQITIEVLDAAGNVIPDFTVIPGDGDARARIPAVAGQTYYLRVLGETGDVINGYDLTIINTPAPVPFDLELADHLTILTGTQEVPPVDTIASGTANFQYDAAANTFDLDLFVFGIELTDMTDLPELTGAHIHRGGIGVNGPVIVDFGIDDWVQEGAGIRLRLTDHPFPAAEIGNLLAGDTYINVHSTANPPGEVRGQILVPNVLGVSDTGRSQFDNVTNDSTPTIFVRLDDAVLLNDLPGNAADVPGALPPAGTIPIPHNPSTDTSPLNLMPGYRVAVFDETDMHNPVPLGFAQPVLGLPGVYAFTFETPLFDGSHFLSARVQMIDPADNDPDAAGLLRATGFGARSQSLEIIVDTVPPPVVFGSIADPFDGLLPPDDTHVIPNPGTISDRITSELAPTFWGRAEANAIIRLYADVDGDGVLDPEVDVFLGQTTAIPLDGTNQEPNGFWQIQSVVNLNNPDFFPDPDGLRTIFVTAEDLAGNVNAPEGLAADTLQIFIDAQGPVIEEVFITDAPDYNLFAPKPDTDGPTPLVNSLTIQFMDLPERVAPDFLFDALKQDVAEHPGHYLLVGDHNGVIPIVDVIVTQAIGPDNIARAWVELVFRDPGPDGLFFTEDDIGAPLPDDRFTLTISDSIIDPAGNRLDGETNAIQPLDPPLFPTGDGIPGGDFVARFTVDSRAEIGVWAAGSVYIDTNGNFVFDPDNPDFTNRDIVYKLGFTSDHIFAGNFKAPGDAAADGFDKLAGYGRVGGEFRFLIDTTNDGVPDLVVTNPLGSNGLPVAGNFDGDPTTGDQVGVLVAGAWHLDTTGDYILDTILPTDMIGYPVVGDFDGDGLVDLGVWRDDTFFLDLSSIGPTANPDLPGLNGSADEEFRFGFPGVRERPIAADFDGDGIDDLGLFVPDRAGMPPSEAAEWYILVSGGRSIVDRLEADPDGPGFVVNFTPTPFGDDIFAQFGDMFAQPVVGNFDPPVAGVNVSQYGLLSFTNPDNPLDVNGDGLVTPLDALIVINALNRDGVHELPAIRADAELSPPFLDVNGDNMLSPLDALLVINHLNSVSLDGEPGGLVAEGESDLAMQADAGAFAIKPEHHPVRPSNAMLPAWWEDGRTERSASRSAAGDHPPLDGTQRALALDAVIDEWRAARVPDLHFDSGRQPLAELDREIDWDEIVEETWWQ